MKILRRLFWIALVLFVVVIAFSQGMGWWWGRDRSELDVRSKAYAFTAKRDVVSGAWQIHAATEASLWFAFGYVQSFDREFQTELIRLAARGEASRLFGEAVLKNDRLMRFARRAAEEEYAQASPRLKSSAEAYVAGREAALAAPGRQAPVEYRIMGVSRQSLPPWEASDIMAIARFHAWQLSYDANLEQLYVQLSDKLGAEAARLLLPSDASDSQALYSQPRLLEGARREEVFHRDAKSPGLALPKPFYPDLGKNPGDKAPPDNAKPDQDAGGGADLGKSIAFNWDTQLALRGASNLWVIADPRVGRPLTLCNDTHLRFTWPASLYPVRYELDGAMRGTGFMLPGVPAMVVGTTETIGGAHPGSLLSWGITLASYGDTQDLVLVDPAESARFVTKQESYPVRDMQSGQIEVRRINETWTPFGPRVDAILTDESKALGAKAILSLDWLGYRRLSSPLEFFVNRNLAGAQNLLADLHERLPYPSLNYTWIESAPGGDPRIGHLTTGWMRGREHRDVDGLRPLKSSEIAIRRKEFQPRDREYFLRDYRGRYPFFLVTANQKIWPQSGGYQLAHTWEPDSRARAIEGNFDADARDPSASQTDFRSPQLMAFLASERHRSTASRLCANSALDNSQCLDLLSQLDGWDGKSTTEAWQTTLAALWHAYLKQEVFTALVPQKSKADVKKLVSDWHRRDLSSGAVQRILSEKAPRLEWEKLSRAKLSDLSIGTFRRALETLVTERGTDPRLWAWGNFHRISWLHPLVQAPEPWGQVIHDSLLGPRPEVPGALDSSGRFEYSWDADHPLDFPATHGAALRMCTEFKAGGGASMRWASPTGPSGNPFSKYSKPWGFEYFFRGLLSAVPNSQ